MSNVQLARPGGVDPWSARAGRSLAELKSELEQHPLYASIRSVAQLRVFLRHHVACVFDFMSLLKSLQRELAPTRVPWLPPRDAEAARLINAIVLDEESDVLPHRPGQHGSHFAWYLDAMTELGVDLAPVHGWLARVGEGLAPHDAMRAAGMPDAAVAFTRTTIVTLGEPLPVRAAVFLHGREDVIPRMFTPMLQRLARQGTSCAVFASYLERHIEVDGGEHGEHGRELVERLCGADPALRERGEQAAAVALEARRVLWDRVLAAITETTH
ncbi:MAG: DUF3050 domain-containing protein [Planctomycetota bacterium]